MNLSGQKTCLYFRLLKTLRETEKYSWNSDIKFTSEVRTLGLKLELKSNFENSMFKIETMEEKKARFFQEFGGTNSESKVTQEQRCATFNP